MAEQQITEQDLTKMKQRLDQMDNCDALETVSQGTYYMVQCFLGRASRWWEFEGDHYDDSNVLAGDLLAVAPEADWHEPEADEDDDEYEDDNYDDGEYEDDDDY